MGLVWSFLISPGKSYKELMVFKNQWQDESFSRRTISEWFDLKIYSLAFLMWEREMQNESA